MICKIICIDGFLSMSHLDIVHMLSAYVHVIHILSEHIHIMCTLSAVVLDIFYPNRQCQYHPYVISNTLYISYHVEFTSFTCHLYHSSYTLLSRTSFRTLPTYMHIVDVICILFRNAYVMYMSSLLLLSVYVHVIYILSGHICIMCTLSEVVLDIFLPNRQYQCHPYQMLGDYIKN